MRCPSTISDASPSAPGSDHVASLTSESARNAATDSVPYGASSATVTGSGTICSTRNTNSGQPSDAVRRTRPRSIVAEAKMPSSGRRAVSRTMYARPASSATSDEMPAPVKPERVVRDGAQREHEDERHVHRVDRPGAAAAWASSSPAVANAATSMPLHTIGIRHATAQDEVVRGRIERRTRGQRSRA